MPESATRSTTIHVCGVNALADTARKVKATHVMTLIRDHGPVETPKGIKSANHLRIDINDITEPADGLVHPQEMHVAELIRFARLWDHRAPMVVHCYAGISRSTAAAFTTLCLLNPHVSEKLIARRLRRSSPTATPNKLIVRIADDILGREGRMVDAISAIGQGEPAYEAVPFSLDSRQRA